MARHKVEIAALDTANIKVLTNEEMIDLFVKYQNGDKTAKEQLVNGNLKLVLSILKQFSGRVDNLDDLFQVGVIGLIKAIDNFDLSYNLKLSTYACPLIIGECKRFLRDNNSIRIARSTKDIAYKALKVKEELTNRLGKEPSITLIAQELDLTEFEVSNALDSMKEIVSMYEPI
ncbi:MAG: sigma-70 family RNA polymerase sigma factor, partial [Bacilli bacterium]|nr:sigma-70 family RNA polymerase sigma factor [Bacilli bacterium]